MKKFKIKAILTLLVIVLAGLYYYVTLPAINIHASGFWGFLIGLVVLVLVLYAVRKRFTSVYEWKESKVIKSGITLILAILLVYGIGAILSSPIVNAQKYRNLKMQARFFNLF